MDNIVREGDKDYDKLFAAWRRNGRARRFTLIGGQMWETKLEDDKPSFRRISTDGMYAQTSVPE